MIIRQMKPNEYRELENFLYETIYVPESQPKPSLACPSRKIFAAKELQPLCSKNFANILPKKISVKFRCPCNKKILRRANFIAN